MQNALSNDLNLLNDNYFISLFDLISSIIYHVLAINTLLKFDLILVFFTIIVSNILKKKLLKSMNGSSWELFRQFVFYSFLLDYQLWRLFLRRYQSTGS